MAPAATLKYQPSHSPCFYLGCIFSPAQTFYKAGGVTSVCPKMKGTYLLEQKCPNAMCLPDHKSAIVNLGKTKLPTARIYILAKGQITHVTVCSLQTLCFISHSLNIPKGSLAKNCKPCLKKHPCPLIVLPVACEHRVFSFVDIKLWGF